MKRDAVRSLGVFLEVETADGYRVVLSPDEIESVRGRREGGVAIHTFNGRRPIMLDVPVDEVIAAMDGGRRASTV
jgi:hypothetical protein